MTALRPGGTLGAALAEAQQAIEAGRFERAAAVYGRLIAGGLREPAVLTNHATCLKRLGQWDAALAGFEQAFRLRRLLAPQRPVSPELSTYAVSHLAEQLDHLHAAGLMAYDQVVSTMMRRAVRFLSNAYGPHGAGPLPPALYEPLRYWLVGCPCYDVSEPEGSVLNPAVTMQAVALGESGDAAYVFDDVLSAAALAALRRFLVGATIWSDARPERGYLGAHLHDGLANALTRRLSRAMAELVRPMVGRCRWVQLWAFKYAPRAEGIDLHADQADWNLNFWPTASEHNLDPASGGLAISSFKVPPHWTFGDYNAAPERNAALLAREGSSLIEIAYRGNRAVLFPSAYLHRTAGVAFPAGYDARRINLTFMADSERS